MDQVFDLFVNLGATDEQLDFPIIYASALNGVAGLEHEELAEDMTPLFEAIVKHVEPPKVELDAPFQMQISQLDYNNYVGVIGIGRIKRGSIKPNQPVTIINSEGKLVKVVSVKYLDILVYNVMKKTLLMLAILLLSLV